MTPRPIGHMTPSAQASKKRMRSPITSAKTAGSMSLKWM